MAKLLLELDVQENATQIVDRLSKNSTASCEFLQDVIRYLEGVSGGVYNAAIRARIATVQATITGTFTGNPTNGETISINGQTITAVTSGATVNQFNIGASATANAAALAAAINASTSTRLQNIVTATSNAGVVTITAVLSGVQGNGITLADSMSNFTWAGSATVLASGSDGTRVTHQFGLVFS